MVKKTNGPRRDRPSLGHRVLLSQGQRRSSTRIAPLGTCSTSSRSISNRWPATTTDRVAPDNFPERGRYTLIILGIVCLVLGAIFDLGILWFIGAVLVIVGVIFWILGALGRAVGGRRHYY